MRRRSTSTGRPLLSTIFCSIIAFGVFQATLPESTVASPPVRAPRPLNLNTIIDHHRRATRLIDTIDAKIDVFGQDFIGPRAKNGETQIGHLRWIRAGSRERLKFRAVQIVRDREGHPVGGLYDIYQDGRVRRGLSNWDWDNPSEITPAKQGAVSAYVKTQDRNSMTGDDPAVPLLLSFRRGGGDQVARSMPELIARGTAQPRLRWTTTNGRRLLRIRLAHPGFRGKPAARGSYLDFFVDPEVNFHIRRYVEYNAALEVYDPQTKTTRNVGVVKTREVLRFRRLGNGVFFPIEATYSFRRDDLGKVTHIERTVVKDCSINTELPQDAFDFRFPEHVRVYHMPSADADFKVEIWGKDDRPVATLNSPKELRDFLAKYRNGDNDSAKEGSSRTSYSTVFRIVIILAVVAGIFLGAWSWRRGTRSA